MDWTTLIAALAFVTLLAFVGFAFVSKRKVEDRMDDPAAPKSTLATDKDSKGTPADV